jgi:hypothetical protein
MLDGVRLLLGEDMRIPLEGEGDVSMAEPHRHDMRWNAGQE